MIGMDYIGKKEIKLMNSILLGEKIISLKQKLLNFMESVINEPKFHQINSNIRII